MTGLDAGAGLLAVAAERLGPGVPLHRADLAEPLPFTDAAIAEAGLSLVTLDEPDPTPDVEQRDPRAWRLLTTAPRFLFVVAAA